MFRGGYSHILAIRVCAAGEGMVFKPFGLVKCLVIIENWSSIGSRLTGSLAKNLKSRTKYHSWSGIHVGSQNLQNLVW